MIKWIIRPTTRDNFSGQNMIKIEEMELRNLEPHAYYNFTSDSKQNVIVTNIYPARYPFDVGYVVSTFPDGKVRVRSTDGKVLSVWPDEVSRVTPTS